jgi:hypothetical protein
MQFCGQFVDGEDSSYEVPSKKEFKEGVEMVMPLELIDFITPLYDLYDTDEDEEENVEEENVVENVEVENVLRQDVDEIAKILLPSLVTHEPK